MPIRKVLARNVRRLRLERQWSQEDLAEATGLHRTYVGAIERSERNLSLASIERLAQGLGVKPYELLLPRGEDKSRV